MRKGLHTPIRAALLIAVITSAVVGGGFPLIFQSEWKGALLLYLAVVLLTFFVSFLAAYFIVGFLLAKRVAPLFRMLYGRNIGANEILEQLDGEAVYERLERDISAWSSEKTREIDRLKEMERYRKEFLGNVSHELKTPIFNIQGYVLSLLDGALEDPAVNRKYLERTEKSIDRLIGIVEDLEAISKLEAGELKLNLTSFNIVSLIRDSIDALDERARKRSISLRLVNQPVQPVMVYADRKRMSEVLLNLLLNSINYGIDGGQTLISVSEEGNRVVVSINDNGIGIDSKDLPRIFERFYRVDKSRSREQGGTGLGLAIVKHIIEAHGQKIKVSSTPNEGTTFSFTIRLSES